MEDLRKLKDEATKAFTKGKFPRAVELWEQVCKADPKDLQSQIKLGDALAKAGKKPQAVHSYQVVAEAYATQGFLPKAIAVCKVLLEVDPSHSETQRILAGLYAKKLGRPESTAGQPPAPARPVTQAPAPAPTPTRALVPPPPPPPPPAAVEREAPATPDDAPLELDRDDHAQGLGPQGAPTASHGIQEAPEESVALPPPAPVVAAKPPPPPPPPAEVPARVEAAPVRPSSRVDLPIAIDVEPSPALVQRHAVGQSPLETDTAAEAEAPGAPSAPTEAQPSSLAPPPRPRTQELEWATAPDDSIGASLESTLESQAGAADPGAAAALNELDFGESTEAEPVNVEQAFDVPMAGATEEEIEILSITAEVAAQPSRPMPRIPLFSDLAPEAFVELMEKCGFVRAEPGQRVIEEGSSGNSFFVVCSGKMKVVKRSGESEVTMAYLPEGSFFGELALLSGTPRAATVIAEEDSELIELAAPVLNDLARRYPHVAGSLRQFGRQRLLSNVMATSALFRPFDRADRKRLAELFKVREVPPGEKVVEEGKPTDGLYLVMSGEMEVVRQVRGKPTTLAALRDGDVFGEMSLLSKKLASADVAARRRSTVLRLPRDKFEELIVTYPQVLVLLSELADSRSRAGAAVMASVLPTDASRPAL